MQQNKLIKLTKKLVSINSITDTKNLKTNVIFISAPDEENASAGVLAAGKYLHQLKSKQNLEYIGLINLDCGLDDESSNKHTIVAGGAIGKLLSCFYVVGKSAHVS